MPFSVRKELRDATTPVHGGPDYERLRRSGLEPEDILDFSTSTNPFPPCPAVADAVADAARSRYPDSASWELRCALAERDGIRPECILVTNGVSQAIFLVAFAFADRGDVALEAAPTYGDYAIASRLAGATVEDVPALSGEHFAFPAERLRNAVERRRPALVWVCSPNNPTGALATGEEIALLREACARERSLPVLDESYVNLAPPGSSLLPSTDGVLVLRSMTKDYGLPGVRLGYVVGEPALIGHLSSLQPSWSVNACAQAAGIAAVRNQAYYEKQWTLLRSLSAELASDVRAAGYAPFPSGANFLLFSAEPVERLHEFLWERRIVVRDCASFGLKGFVRIGVRGRGENERLVAALRAFREETA